MHHCDQNISSVCVNFRTITINKLSKALTSKDFYQVKADKTRPKNLYKDLLKTEEY